MFGIKRQKKIRICDLKFKDTIYQVTDSGPFFRKLKITEIPSLKDVESLAFGRVGIMVYYENADRSFNIIMTVSDFKSDVADGIGIFDTSKFYVNKKKAFDAYMYFVKCHNKNRRRKLRLNRLYEKIDSIMNNFVGQLACIFK